MLSGIRPLAAFPPGHGCHRESLRELLGGPVDLSPLKTLKEHVRDKAKLLCLPFSEPQLSLADLSDASALSENSQKVWTWKRFARILKRSTAVERKLLVISEAAIRLGEEAQTLCPGINRGSRDKPHHNVGAFSEGQKHFLEFHRDECS